MTHVFHSADALIAPLDDPSPDDPSAWNPYAAPPMSASPIMPAPKRASPAPWDPTSGPVIASHPDLPCSGVGRFPMCWNPASVTQTRFDPAVVRPSNGSPIPSDPGAVRCPITRDPSVISAVAFRLPLAAVPGVSMPMSGDPSVSWSTLFSPGARDPIAIGGAVAADPHVTRARSAHWDPSRAIPASLHIASGDPAISRSRPESVEALYPCTVIELIPVDPDVVAIGRLFIVLDNDHRLRQGRCGDESSDEEER